MVDFKILPPIFYMDSYLTVKKPARVIINIKKSKFIASLKNVKNEAEAKNFINEIKKEFKDASHNPYAYVVNDIFNSSDDSEPLNTAGKPILDVILKKNLKNVVIVVTRYFGGIKLGVGGLIRAYREAALKGIEASGTIEKFYEEEISFFVDYEFFGEINKTIQKYRCKILEKKMENNAFFKISIRKRDKENFLNEILKKTKGKVKLSF
ncbi:YigZ family protein [Thermococci archaeon]|nr:MAG: YigZ family protein [Thermococci archaeon]RLF96524.1 MAG: YigZ family protein [Thermococci archaeon]